MRIAYIITILMLLSCSPSEKSLFPRCNIEFMNTYLDRCQEHCGYEDEGYNCEDTCIEYAKEKYCN